MSRANNLLRHPKQRARRLPAGLLALRESHLPKLTATARLNHNQALHRNVTRWRIPSRNYRLREMWRKTDFEVWIWIWTLSFQGISFSRALISQNLMIRQHKCHNPLHDFVLSTPRFNALCPSFVVCTFTCVANRAVLPQTVISFQLFWFHVYPSQNLLFLSAVQDIVSFLAFSALNLTFSSHLGQMLMFFSAVSLLFRITEFATPYFLRRFPYHLQHLSAIFFRLVH